MEHRANRPVTAQLEVHYSSNDSKADPRVVGTLLRVQQHPEAEQAAGQPAAGIGAGGSGAMASLQTHLSNNMQVCDLYQCVHHHHYHHHDDWFINVPVCARRFSESNLARLPGHVNTELADGAQGARGLPARRTVSCSASSSSNSNSNNSGQVECLPSVPETNLAPTTNIFRKDYTFHDRGTRWNGYVSNSSSVESLHELRSPTNTKPNAIDVADDEYPESLHACQVDFAGQSQQISPCSSGDLSLIHI